MPTRPHDPERLFDLDLVRCTENGALAAATILLEQRTVSRHGEETTLRGRGRHDPCVLPRAVPIVEAMAALVLADHALRQETAAGRRSQVAGRTIAGEP